MTNPKPTVPASREAVAEEYRERAQAQRRAEALEEAKRRALLRDERRTILEVTAPRFEELERRIAELEARLCGVKAGGRVGL